ncbi:hypothetical protein [Pseudorhodoferax sp. Leaf274]|uniref:hypothetical protein n=1 Tax=Pseudorhodoferax sp. Leaf274 TaxID=1736318 RepID=UPI0012E32459|nr:hypothetical protein [Pseudorhodoferax sp. Leaf274]
MASDVMWARRKVLTEVLVPWVGVVALIVGGVFGLWQYAGKLHGDRVERTMKFRDEFRTGNVAEASAKVAETWTTRQLALASKLRDKNTTRAVFATYVADVLQEAQSRSALLLVSEFYDDLAVCVKEGVCDKGTAKTFFAEGARLTYNLHEGYFEEVLARQSIQAGEGMRYIALLK